jgi:hypothetical protein
MGDLRDYGDELKDWVSDPKGKLYDVLSDRSGRANLAIREQARSEAWSVALLVLAGVIVWHEATATSRKRRRR